MGSISFDTGMAMLTALIIVGIFALVWWKLGDRIKRIVSDIIDAIKGVLPVLVYVLAFMLAASPFILAGCGQGGSWSGTAHPPVADIVRSVPVMGPYAQDILIDDVAATVEPGYQMDEIRLTVLTLWAGGGPGTYGNFAVGADCEAPTAVFPPLELVQGASSSITDRATLDALLPLLTTGPFYVCPDIPSVDMDLEVRIKGSVSQGVQ